MHVGHIELFVQDPRAASRFYIDVLGCGLVADQGRHAVWAKSGRLEILLRAGHHGRAPDPYAAAPSALVLYTEDLPAALARLQRAGVEIRGNDGSEKCPTFSDLDGHWFQLVDPRSH